MHLQILQFAEEVAKEKVADLLCLNMGTFMRCIMMYLFNVIYIHIVLYV